jgi:hypothetical protein
MLKFRLYQFGSGPSACFDEEPEPRNWLLSGLLSDQSYEEDIEMFLGEIAKAEEGQPGIVVGNHAVWALMSRDKMVLEEMLYGDDKTNGTEPARTEITLAEARQLILDWREAERRWYAEHRAKDGAEASAPVRSNAN